MVILKLLQVGNLRCLGMVGFVCLLRAAYAAAELPVHATKLGSNHADSLFKTWLSIALQREGLIGLVP